MLFAIQPMVAKALLPVFGGTPAVWTVCMLFFQSLLLVAYGYAWLLSRIPDSLTWRLSHSFFVLLSLFVLPLGFSPAFIGEGTPELVILGYLLRHLGLPLLIVGASAPLLQFAYSHTKGKQAHDPYFLYVASNLGSLLALAAYPWLIERYIGLSKQFYYWNFIFGVYVILLAVVFFAFSYRHLQKTTIKTTQLDWLVILKWIGYSFIPCSLMLSVTSFISTDIAATPLFWVIPLALYLLSFVITFAKRPLISHEWIERNALFFIIFPILGFIFNSNSIQAWQLIIFHLLNFFVLALLCHGHLVNTRPPSGQLTIFYLSLAFGGMLAGLFNGLIAPRLFNAVYEYPLVLALATLCIPLFKQKGLRMMPLLVLAVLLVNYYLPNQGGLILIKKYKIAEVLALCLALLWARNSIGLFVGVSILFFYLFSPWFKGTQVILQQRNFYGVKQVFSLAGTNVLMSQNTVHGFQLQQPEASLDGAMAYYAPVLAVVQQLQRLHQPLRSIILGLGTGMMACQYQKGDQVKMIDIDEQVIWIASKSGLFSYLRDCPAQVSLIEGDGRMVLHDGADAGAELLIVDAFSSDAIPMHLLTLEAFQLYQQKITPDGVILVHISNRHLRLLPVLTAAGRQLDLIVLHKFHSADNKKGQLASEWVLLTANQPLALTLMREEGWHFVAEGKTILWTDDYSNLIPLLK
nr:fused MFS/spermidine synthase [Legionella sp. PL877]